MFEHPSNAILKQLHTNGHQAYYVGGCVRDYLLRLPFNDIDIATSATPEQVMAIFERTIPTGIAYGTVTVLYHQHSYEVTTFRCDLDYTDGRRPTAVSFGKQLKDDLARRDFTMNAIAMSLDGALFDPFGGKQSIKDKVIDTVGSPVDRFKEDKLRKLRAIRFASQKNFTLSPSLMTALIEDPSLLGVSAERIFTEMNKLLMSSSPDAGLRLLAKTKLLDNIHPVFTKMVGLNQQSPYHKYDVFEHTVRVVKNAPKVLHLRWAALLHDTGKPACKTIDDKGIGHFYGHEKASAEIARDILNYLKVPNTFKYQVLHLIVHHSHFPVERAKPLRRFIKKIGKENVDDLLLLMRADAMSKGTNLGMTAKKIDQLRRAVDIILNTTPALSLKELAISGSDLLLIMPELNHNKKRIGIILNALLDAVIENPEINTKTSLIELAQKM